MPRVTRRQITAIAFVALEEITDIADDTTEPYNAMQEKIAGLVELLNCTEAEAERIVLDYTN